MIDFHSHILPGIDDGSKSVDESCRMLKESFLQGVSQIVATPHFYAEDNSPKRFLERRRHSFEKLEPHLTADMPEIFLGAEVKYFEGISRSEDVGLLKIEGTDLILIEMPFMTWNQRIVNEVIELASWRHTRVILAHVERYFRYGAEKFLPDFYKNDVLIQANAESFIGGRFATRKVMNMLKEGKIHLLGSDCHNMGSRSPNMGDARKEISKRICNNMLDKLDEKAYNSLYSGSNIDFPNK
ncbi:MAG: capsular polysaccharide biosynthesis protein [Oscillospiraceae bacterium]|nr:capsular polysaccharide biosynthesis protein [Oscillospiraceae bacterium]